MASIENKYLSMNGDDAQPDTRSRWFKAGAAVMACSPLLLFFVVSTVSNRTSTAETTNLIAAPSSMSLRANPIQRVLPRTPSGAAVVPRSMYPQDLSSYGTGLSGMKKYAMKQFEAAILDNRRRDISAKAEKSEFAEIQEERDAAAKAKEAMEDAEKAVKLKVEDMAGVTAPLGFFDPVGFCTDASAGKILFYREVELKHGRVGMLASLGFLVGENFHPLFGGDIDVPAYVAFQQTPLQTFWQAVVVAIAIPEVFSVFTFESPFGMNIMDQIWKTKVDHKSGDLGFDPLGLKPSDPKELKELQTKEINNGRLAMIAAAGMIAQELATGQKLLA